MSKRRVVITGIGMVTPLGCGSRQVWTKLIEGNHGAHMENFSSLHVSFPICTVPRGDSPLDFNESAIDSNLKDLSTFIKYAAYAATLAVEDAGGLHQVNKLRAGVSIASGIGSVEEISKASSLLEQSHRKLSPWFIPKILINMAAGCVSIKYGLKGPNHSATTACAAGGHSLGDAYNFIRLNYADMMLAGGTESSNNDLSVAGFHRLRALSTIQSAKDASRPFDQERKGFVIGEGAAVLVLEELQCALARGATIIAEVSGYGLSGDAYHMTSPCPDGDGAKRSMESALMDAGLTPEDISYINAHATSTPVGDEIEVRAIESVFHSLGKKLLVSSTKGATGHLLGAAGAMEAAFVAYAVKDNIIPPTLNLDNPIPASFTHVANSSFQVSNMNHAMSNSFGFGGTNCSLIISKYRE